MHYLIYKTTCTINGKYYVGKHKTKNRDDDYLGSGKLLRAAIKKYGKENFVREILLECSDEDEMNLAEKILVVPDVEVNYNLCPGGQGGWGYLNDGSDEHRIRASKAAVISNTSAKGRKGSLARNEKYGVPANFLIAGKTSFLGKKHTEETKQKISVLRRGKGNGNMNSQFGTCWMTDGAKNVKIKRDEVDRWIEMGYKLGRTRSILNWK